MGDCAVPDEVIDLAKSFVEPKSPRTRDGLHSYNHTNPTLQMCAQPANAQRLEISPPGLFLPAEPPSLHRAGAFDETKPIPLQVRQVMDLR